MKKLINSGYFNKFQYAIYPSYNVIESLDIKKKQVFERILTHLLNKYMPIMTDNSYSYNSLRTDLKIIYDSIDVMNKSFEYVLHEVDAFIYNRITTKSFENKVKQDKNYSVLHTDNNDASSALIKRVKFSDLKSRNTEKIVIKLKNKTSLSSKQKKESQRTTIPLKPLRNKTEIKYNTNQPNSYKIHKNLNNEIENQANQDKQKENDFLQRLGKKYISIETDNAILIKKRVKNFNSGEMKKMFNEPNNLTIKFKKKKQLNPIENSIVYLNKTEPN